MFVDGVMNEFSLHIEPPSYISRSLPEPLMTFKLHPEFIAAASKFVRPNKKIDVFRVTQPYLNLLLKPSIFQVFWKKNTILCI